jgi:hypothetical protein
MTMKIRYLFAGLFLILELPVLLPLAAGALVTGAVQAVAALCSQARRIRVPVRSSLRKPHDDRVARPALGS